MGANDRQEGGDHYRKVPGEQLWDRAWRLKMDIFQFGIIQYVERHRDKGGIADLVKAQHYLEKYIEVLKEGADTHTDETQEIDAYIRDLNAAVLSAKAQQPNGRTTYLTTEEEIKDWIKDEAAFRKDAGVAQWDDYTYEGFTSASDLVKCLDCKKQFYIPKGTNPSFTHQCEGKVAP